MNLVLMLLSVPAMLAISIFIDGATEDDAPDEDDGDPDTEFRHRR